MTVRSDPFALPASRGIPPQWLLLACLCAFGLPWQGGCSSEPPPPVASDTGEAEVPAVDEARTIAFVTNQIADFWNIAKAGCQDAAKDFGLEVEVKMPPEATVVEQKRIVEDLLTAGVDAIAISPLDADNQTDFLNKVAEKVPLITHDSDAPNCNRLMYIGMDNYKAGRMCGELVKEALPEGGKVMIFIGRLEQTNSKYRRQGVIDELLDRPEDPSRFDPVDQPIEGEKYTILGTITDQGKHEVAKEKAADAINTYPEMQAMVGLFEYNPPAIYQALSQAEKLGQIKLIGFDENDLTLQAIKDGDCTGTVVQDPYQYGYRSVEKLVEYLKDGEAAIPDDKYVDIPPRKITQENVDEFWADLRAKKGG
ncbi:MAG: substrate-binding domain-containing protein [Planctomycetales bacterium]|nr:substrate-binding domain-containing protein [Planctomycetales bacterium]NIM08971.1 substrate-binding domain-containing protein [Planctomycetales bacterium]NIN08434.1 substrate-binding domain-containing protein [Planctomycetales bacterium]NIN77563.1 substrate-binding domain-containing protein [Planctomycetales bacterium]NIO34733.1 substrate-binding domain-containing protein [Planctomycetales bacterium]